MNKVSISVKRIIAFIIDWNCICVLGIIFMFVSPNFDIEYILRPSIKMFSIWGLLLVVLNFLIMPLIKDCILNGASLGKWMLGLKVVNKDTKKTAGFLKLILRNILFYYPLIELIFMLINNGTTLGDLITGTTVGLRKECVKSKK